MKDFESLVMEMSAIELEDENNRTDLQLENGKALGTTWAAYCIQDMIRTKIFVKRLFSAIGKVSKVVDRPVHVLYAGTGPFATLALPVMAKFLPAQVQFKLLEINKTSFDCVQKVISELGFDSLIINAFQADATKFVIDKNHPIDIVLTETMQHALAREQQVGINMNLMNQLADDVILIPENISLELCLMNINRFHNRGNHEGDKYCYKLGKIFELNREKIKVYNQICKQCNFEFPKHEIAIPSEIVKDYDCLVVLTEIHVFEDNRILINQSGLTIPLILDSLSESDNKPVVQIGYSIKEEPGVYFKYVRN